MVEIQIAKKDLLLLQKALIKRSAVAQTMTLATHDNTLTLAVANNEYTIAQSFPTNDTNDTIMASVQVSADMLKAMLKAHVKCTLSLQDDAVLVQDDRMSVMEPTMPAPASIEAYQTLSTLDATQLKNVLAQVAMAASTDTVIPIYHHILLTADANGLHGIAGGRLMAAAASDDSSTYTDQFSFLLPSPVAVLLLDNDIAQDIRIQQSANNTQLAWNNSSITFAHVDAALYPRPRQYRTAAITSISRTALNAAMLRTVLAYSDDDNYRILAVVTVGGTVSLEALGVREVTYTIGTTTTDDSRSKIHSGTLENIISTVPNDTFFTIYSTEKHEAIILATATATYMISTIRGL